jgi:hypothetical protein
MGGPWKPGRTGGSIGQRARWSGEAMSVKQEQSIALHAALKAAARKCFVLQVLSQYVRNADPKISRPHFRRNLSADIDFDEFIQSHCSKSRSSEPHVCDAAAVSRQIIECVEAVEVIDEEMRDRRGFSES